VLLWRRAHTSEEHAVSEADIPAGRIADLDTGVAHPARVYDYWLVVYVDNDPIVLLHAQELLRSTPQGATGYLQADLRDPGPGSSPGLSWSNRDWYRSTSGAPTPVTSPPRAWSPRTERWAARWRASED
jgi:S-adenosyl methyltransferase